MKEPKRPTSSSSSSSSSNPSTTHSVTRTRSESDLIRARALHSSLGHRGSFSDSDSDDDDSLDGEEEKRCTSLRSFTSKDEERHARAVKEGTFLLGGHCSRIKEEVEEKEPETEPAERTSEQERRSTSPDSETPGSTSLGAKQSVVSQKSESRTVTTMESPLKDEDTKTMYSLDEGTSTISGMGDEVVDAEYLSHENDLLKNSLEQVCRERDYLAQDNWNLRMELESLRNQMRFMMTTTEAPAYNRDIITESSSYRLNDQFHTPHSPQMLSTLREECHDVCWAEEE